jgi:hypothetical protein
MFEILKSPVGIGEKAKTCFKKTEKQEKLFFLKNLVGRKGKSILC